MATLILDKGGLVAHLIRLYAARLAAMTTKELIREFKKKEGFWDTVQIKKED